jgi:hypothetical protein
VRTTLNSLTPLLVAAAAAATIAAAPLAAASQLSCIDAGSATQCGSPGNVQITANTPPVQFQPQFPFFVGGDSFVGGDHHRR